MKERSYCTDTHCEGVNGIAGAPDTCPVCNGETTDDPGHLWDTVAATIEVSSIARWG